MQTTDLHSDSVSKVHIDYPEDIESNMTDVYGLLGWLMSGFGVWNLSLIIQVVLQAVMSPHQAEDWASRISGPVGGLVAIIIMCIFFFYMWNKSHKAHIELLERGITNREARIMEKNKRILELENKLMQ